MVRGSAASQGVPLSLGALGIYDEATKDEHAVSASAKNNFGIVRKPFGNTD